jgi:hypothetical protein
MMSKERKIVRSTPGQTISRPFAKIALSDSMQPLTRFIELTPQSRHATDSSEVFIPLAGRLLAVEHGVARTGLGWRDAVEAKLAQSLRQHAS